MMGSGFGDAIGDGLRALAILLIIVSAIVGVVLWELVPYLWQHIHWN